MAGEMEILKSAQSCVSFPSRYCKMFLLIDPMLL